MSDERNLDASGREAADAAVEAARPRGSVDGTPGDTAADGSTKAVPSLEFPGTDADGGRMRAPEPARPARRGPSSALVAVAAACCVALVVFSLGFMKPSADGGWSLAWIVGGDSVSAAASAPDASERDGEDDGSPADGASEDAADRDRDADGTDGGSKGGAADSADGASSKDGSSGASASGKAPSKEGATSSSGGQSGGASSSGAGQSGGASSSGGNAPARDTITVTVSIDSSAADGSVSGSGTFTFERGATAYDALLALTDKVVSENTFTGIYVSAIGGLAEKQFGGGSGWNYAVNGSTPGYSCGAYELSDGDTVSWFYVV